MCVQNVPTRLSELRVFAILLGIACGFLPSAARAQSGCQAPASVSFVYTGNPGTAITNITASLDPIASLSYSTIQATCVFSGVPTSTGGGFRFNVSQGATFTVADVDGSYSNLDCLESGRSGASCALIR